MMRPIFYGWWIAIAALVINALLSAPSFGSAGLWVDALEAEFGWSRTQLAIAFSLGQLEGSIASPIVGFLIDKIGAKKVSLIGTAVAMIGFVLLSQTTPITDSRDNWIDPLIFYFSYITIMFGGTLAGWIPMMAVVNNWFSRKRSLAMSIASIGFTSGTFLLVPVLAFLINPNRLGFEITALLVSVSLLGAVFLTWKIIKNTPEEMGVLPDGEIRSTLTLATKGGSDKIGATTPDFTIVEAMRERVFWILAVGHGSSAMLTSAMMVHLILAFKDQGLSIQIAATLWGVTMAIGGLAQLFGGYIGDKFPKRYALAGFGCLQSIGVILSVTVNSVQLAILFALTYGIGFGTRAPISTAIRGEYFGRTSFGRIMGIASVPMMLMSVVTPIFAGRMYDSTGDYSTAFISLGIAGFVGSLIFLTALPPRHPSLKAL